MRAGTCKKDSNKADLNWQRDAELLGVDRTHLYRVITGKRQSLKLTIAFQNLKSKQSAQSKTNPKKS